LGVCGIIHEIYDTVENIKEKQRCMRVKKLLFQFPFKSKTTEHHLMVETSL